MFFNWFKSKPKGYTDLKSEAFQLTLKSKGKFHLVDVRTESEFRTGHIKGSKNLNLMSSQFSHQIQKLSKEEPLFLYCRSGNRSSTAAKQCVKMGFKEIYNLKGGLIFWGEKLV
jgi:rhodanese-related sulfurtransferase